MFIKKTIYFKICISWNGNFSEKKMKKIKQNKAKQKDNWSNTKKCKTHERLYHTTSTLPHCPSVSPTHCLTAYSLNPSLSSRPTVSLTNSLNATLSQCPLSHWPTFSLPTEPLPPCLTVSPRWPTVSIPPACCPTPRCPTVLSHSLLSHCLTVHCPLSHWPFFNSFIFSLSH